MSQMYQQKIVRKKMGHFINELSFLQVVDDFMSDLNKTSSQGDQAAPSSTGTIQPPLRTLQESSLNLGRNITQNYPEK